MEPKYSVFRCELRGCRLEKLRYERPVIRNILQETINFEMQAVNSVTDNFSLTTDENPSIIRYKFMIKH
jgi:hypothetical protein